MESTLNARRSNDEAGVRRSADYNPHQHASPAIRISDTAIPRKTISREVRFDGVGVHSGDRVTLYLRSSERGIVWKMDGRQLHEPTFDYTNTHTTIVRFKNGESITCTEHLLAALYMLEISDLEIDIRGGTEVPFLDGSGLDYYTSLKDCVTPTQGGLQKQISISLPHVIHGRDGIGYMVLLPAPELSVECSIDYPNPIGRQTAKMSAEDPDESIISARSFIRDPLDRVPILEAGTRRLLGLSEITSMESLILWDSEAVLSKLRFPNEFAKHKVVDILGDLYTTNYRLRFRILAHRPGHELNRRVADYLAKNAVE